MKQNSKKDGNDFTDVAGQQELDRFPDVIIDTPALLYRRYNGGKIVIH